MLTFEAEDASPEEVVAAQALDGALTVQAASHHGDDLAGDGVVHPAREDSRDAPSDNQGAPARAAEGTVGGDDQLACERRR